MLKIKVLSVLSLALFFNGMGVNEGYRVGDVVEDFELKGVSGETVSLSDYKDSKGVILILIATRVRCHNCTGRE